MGRTFDPATAFVVDDLKPNTEYAFRLAARSPQGLGAFTSVVRQRTLQSSRCLADPALPCGGPQRPPTLAAPPQRVGGAWPRTCLPALRRWCPQAPLPPPSPRDLEPWGAQVRPLGRGQVSTTPSRLLAPVLYLGLMEQPRCAHS